MVKSTWYDVKSVFNNKPQSVVIKSVFEFSWWKQDFFKNESFCDGDVKKIALWKTIAQLLQLFPSLFKAYTDLSLSDITLKASIHKFWFLFQQHWFQAIHSIFTKVTNEFCLDTNWWQNWCVILLYNICRFYHVLDNKIWTKEEMIFLQYLADAYQLKQQNNPRWRWNQSK